MQRCFKSIFLTTNKVRNEIGLLVWDSSTENSTQCDPEINTRRSNYINLMMQAFISKCMNNINGFVAQIWVSP